MSDRDASPLDRVRQPEYTGENRCVPCSIVNVAIALAASALAGLVAIELAGLVLACSLLAIYLRGYLVPGTPALTERYLPDRVLARFATHPVGGSEDDGQTWDTLEKLEYERENAVDPDQFLRDVDAVDEGGRRLTDEDGRRLTDEFAALLSRRTERAREATVDRETFAELFDVEPGAVTVEDRDYPAIEIDHRIRKWPGDAALVADVAAHDALGEWTERWTDLPIENRLDVLETLRSLLEGCPRCSGDIGFSSDRVDSCCGSFEVIALRCADCEESLREFSSKETAAAETGRGIQP